MSRQKSPNSGWAAFDRRWRGTAGKGDHVDVSSFPPLSDFGTPNSASTSAIENNNRAKPMTFTSVVQPSVEFAAFNNVNGRRHLIDHVENTNFPANSALDNKIKLLKDTHSWANSNLIEDILAGVNNDVDQASSLLKTMISPYLPTGEDGTPDQLVSVMNKIHGLVSENAAVDNKHPDGSHLLSPPMNMVTVPLEPELEELDDDYLNHRKDALKMMRAATKHSQAASNAFSRRDHAAAKELSLKAQEERATAETLNNKAAREIFRLRNSNNDMWQIDMHGLHASEAVAALERHLHMIEFQAPWKNAASVDELPNPKPVITGSNVEFASEKVVLLRPRQAILEVITGIGKHSKGQASLPAAIRGYLIEEGYRFDELRPGVFSVRPKFRRR